MTLHQYFWARILVGKAGHALPVQTSGMSILTPQSLPVLLVKSGPQAAATALPVSGASAFHLGVVEPCLAGSLQCLNPRVALEGV